MSNKKNYSTLFLLLAFTLIGAGAWWFTKEEKTKSQTDLIKEGMRFATKISDIHKIFIAPRDGESTTFVRGEGKDWLVNGTKANPNVMKNLLETLGRVQVDYIPTKASVPHIVKEMAAIGIKVELYDKSDSKIKTFYVGGSTNNELGTFMIMEDSNQPYVTHIPNMQGSLRWRFTPKGDVWKNKGIFEEDPDKITAISIEYPTQKSHSFKLKKEGSDYKISPFYENQLNKGNGVNPISVRSFLNGYNRILAEGFENKNSKRDSVLLTQPFSIIELETDNGDKKTVRFFPQDADRKDNITGEPLMVHRYYVDMNGEDFMVAQQRVIGKLFWGYNQFFE